MKRKIARERVEYLLDLARKTGKKRYVELAWKIKLRYRVKLPRDLKYSFCRKCRSMNLVVRVRRGRISYICPSCGYIRRIPIRKERIKKVR